MIFNKLYKREIDVQNLIEKTLNARHSATNIEYQVSSTQHPASSCLLLTYLNQHCFNIYNSNKEYKNLLDAEFEIFPDGTGINLALKFFGNRNTQRFNATDLNEKIFNHFSRQGTNLFLLGGNFDKKFIYKSSLEKK